ncbi:hypothetical protein Taro_035519 [Colocasia esculenta]|uniref:Uncharacterized protein n=1 Tax=Colocasia esculenta TaxID=4460 RepID=A0A843W6W8_COLES|nr:hypothetical protein [Colocasia esculenta]
MEVSQEVVVSEDVAPSHTEESPMKEASVAVASSEDVAPVHIEDVQMEDAPFQGEPVIQKEAEIQGEPTASAPADPFQEGVVESTSDGIDDVDMEPIVGTGDKANGVATKIPLLTRKAHHRSHKKKKLKVNMKPVIERLNAQEEILCSVQSDISSIFVSQSTGAKEIAMVNAMLQGMRSELGSQKQSVTELSDLEEPVGGPSGLIDEEVIRPPGPTVEESGPPGSSVEDSGPSGPVIADVGSGPSGPVQAEQVRIEDPVEVVVVPPEPPISSPLKTPAPPSPPSSSTAPPAPETFKQPIPKHISSPIPFSATSSSSPISSTSIPPPPIFEEPPASSSSAGPSSVGPSSSGPSTLPPPTTFSTLHPPTPPSFITLIPESAHVPGVVIEDIKDEFEEAILRSVLSVSSHVHRTDSSSPAPKKRKVSKDLALSSEPKFPPFWFSLSVEHKRRSYYCEFLQKCTFATIFGLPHLNLTDHLKIVLPLSPIAKADQSKIVSLAESTTEDQWARGHQSLYRKFVLSKSERFPPKDHPITLSECSKHSF